MLSNSNFKWLNVDSLEHLVLRARPGAQGAVRTACSARLACVRVPVVFRGKTRLYGFSHPGFDVFDEHIAGARGRIFPGRGFFSGSSPEENKPKKKENSTR